jgi:hypothetical protein
LFVSLIVENFNKKFKANSSKKNAHSNNFCRRRKQVENFAVLVKRKRKKQDCLQFSIRYQETKLFGGYSR